MLTNTPLPLRSAASAFLCCFRIRHLQVSTDLSDEKIIDLIVSRNGGGGLSSPIDVNRVLLTFTQEFAPVSFEVAN